MDDDDDEHRANAGRQAEAARRAEPATSAPAPGPISTSGSGTLVACGACTARSRRRRRRPAGVMAGAAPHRVGQPSPLIFHLGAALAAYGQALLAAPRADSPSFPWADGLGADRRGARPTSTRSRSPARSPRACSATIAGLEIWQAHPYRRTLARPAGGLAGRLLAARSTTARRPEATDPARAAGAGGAEPDQPRLHPRPRPGPLDAALAGGAGLPPAAAGLGRRRDRRRRASTSTPTAPSGCCRRSPRRAALAGGPVPVRRLLHGRHARGRARGAAPRRRRRRW